MSFEEKIRELEELTRQRYPASVLTPKRLKLQESFPKEYAEYMRQEDMKECERRLTRSMDQLSLKTIHPMSIHIPCPLSLEECKKRGEMFKQSTGELATWCTFLVHEIDSFQTKYPERFQQFIQNPPMPELPTECSKAYFQGILGLIQKENASVKPKKAKVDIPVVTKVDAPVEVAESKSKKKEATIETPVDPVEAKKSKKKIETKVDVPIETKVETPVEVAESKSKKKVETKVETPVEPVEAKKNKKKIETKVETPVEPLEAKKSKKKIETKVDVPIETKVETPVEVAEPKKSKKKKATVNTNVETNVEIPVAKCVEIKNTVEPCPIAIPIEVLSTTEPYKKKSISSCVKKLVWNKNIGEDVGKAKCYCCKSTDITQTSFHCGHMVAESKGGQTIVSNLKPICQNCNSSMGTKDMLEFMKTLE